MTKIGNVWVFIEQEGGKIADVSLELVCKGKELAAKLGVKVEAVLLGDNVAHCADTLFSYGVKTVFLAEDKRLEPFTVLPYAKVIMDNFGVLDTEADITQGFSDINLKDVVFGCDINTNNSTVYMSWFSQMDAYGDGYAGIGVFKLSDGRAKQAAVGAYISVFHPFSKNNIRLSSVADPGKAAVLYLKAAGELVYAQLNIAFFHALKLLDLHIDAVVFVNGEQRCSERVKIKIAVI